MAEASLIFDEDGLDVDSSLYELYSRLYEGMREANLVESPNYVDNPPLTPDGEIDDVAIIEGLAEYSTILMKNSAYMMANSIVSAIFGGGGSGGPGGGFLSRSGDNMEGKLGALYGFQAGYNGSLILETTINADDKRVVKIYGGVIIDEDAKISGKLNLGNSGIFMSEVNVIFYDDNKLNIASGNIRMTGDISVDGTFQLGKITINNGGLFYDDMEFYHGGNSNDMNFDWDMRDAHVYGDLQVDGVSILNDKLHANNGFSLGANDDSLFYSSIREDESSYLVLATDLNLLSGYGVKFDDKYIIKVRGGLDRVVSLSAPGMTLNLGDSDNGVLTEKIALQTGIYNYSGDYSIVSQYGDGNFPNSLSAGCGNSGPTVLQTYYKSGDDCGVVFFKKIRFSSSSGPSLNSPDIETLVFEAPYIHVENSVQQTDHIQSSIQYIQTNSLFKDQSKNWSASLCFHTDAEFFVFDKPIESSSFSIISNQYKTQLLENSLFFGDGVFLEGVANGILFSGNTYYTDSLSSQKFASGFAGYGWSITKDMIYGNIVATVDELVVRKKMRIYELEVQKSEVTNGSLWVSDSCSGDLVEEII